MMTASNQVENCLRELDGARGPGDAREALTTLIKAKQLHAARDDARLHAFLDRMASVARDASKDAERLLALGLLARVVAVVGRLKGQVGDLIERAVTSPLPPLSLVADGDDRFYAAQALAYPKGDWKARYLAQSIVAEETGEKVRSELTNLLVRETGNVSDAVRLVGDEFREFSPSTEAPGDSTARRLRRVLSAFRAVTKDQSSRAGAEVGASCNALFVAAFGGVQGPSDTAVVRELVEEAAAFLHELIRTQIELVTDSSIYGAIEPLRLLMSAGEWKRLVEESPGIAALVDDVVAALTLLARQGVTDSDLFSRLLLLTASRDVAKSHTAAIADRHTGFSADVQAWLRTGGAARPRAASGLADESQLLAADDYLAHVVVEGAKDEAIAKDVADAVLPELDILDPALASAVRRLVTGCDALFQGIRRLAAKRQLSLFGATSQRVEYSPLEHELGEHAAGGVRWVKVVRPGVMRVADGKARTVVLKAIVKPDAQG